MLSKNQPSSASSTTLHCKAFRAGEIWYKIWGRLSEQSWKSVSSNWKEAGLVAKVHRKGAGLIVQLKSSKIERQGLFAREKKPCTVGERSYWQVYYCTLLDNRSSVMRRSYWGSILQSAAWLHIDQWQRPLPAGSTGQKPTAGLPPIRPRLWRQIASVMCATTPVPIHLAPPLLLLLLRWVALARGSWPRRGGLRVPRGRWTSQTRPSQCWQLAFLWWGTRGCLSQHGSTKIKIMLGEMCDQYDDFFGWGGGGAWLMKWMIQRY